MQKYDLKMSGEISNKYHEEELHYSIDDIMELYGLDQWTIRMWAYWFEIHIHLSADSNGILFNRHAAEQIGEIRSLMKKKMKLKEIRKYLESGNNLKAT